MITVISLFDGMSCGQIALDQLGIKVDRYFASEVDKYAMQVTKDNYPDTIHIGDVSKIRVKKRANYVILIDEWGNRYKIYEKIILIGGSPCQGFSFAGKMEGAVTECKIEITTLEQYLELKRNKFEFKGQSYLFWEYIRIKETIEPTHFLLENVRMTAKCKDMFDTAVGCKHVFINSSLLSAQSRPRLYWSDLPIRQPRDEKIYIEDIIEDEVDDKYYMKQSFDLLESKDFSRDGLKHIANVNVNGHDILKRVYDIEGKSPTLNACTGGNREVKVLIVAQRGRYLVDGKRQDHKMKTAGLTTQRLEDKKSNCLTTVQKDNYVLIVPEATKQGYSVIEDGDCFDATFIKSKTRRGRNMKDKSNCLTAANYDYMRFEYPRVRKLTPIECERLQTVPDDYTKSVSNSQRYKMLGNGWTVSVIKHICKRMCKQID